MTHARRFNPLDPRNLGASVAQALLQQQPVPLREIQPFTGAGIYAIYYTGSFEPYEPIASQSRDGKFGVPIYVGKAVPAGARKGGTGQGGGASKALYKRLMEHADSIGSVANLDIHDFFCRYLVVDDIWIPLGESLLIAKFSPIWNNIIDGFGNHDPGKGRYEGMRPRWDVLHPGRAWATRCRPRQDTPEQIIAELRNHFRSIVLPTSTTILFGNDGEGVYSVGENDTTT